MIGRTFHKSNSACATQVLPQHVAIIMDGNGRWAKMRGLSRIVGHKRGAKVLEDIIDYSAKIGVGVLTLFAFSSENWRRPALEVNALMTLMTSAMQKNLDKMHKNNIRFSAIGELSQLPSNLNKILQTAEELTQNNTGMCLNFAVNYGGKWDIANSCQQIAAKVLAGELAPSDITEDYISQNLSLSNLPEVDLLIRTSGEQRLSNFLIWQAAYAEIYFSEVMWPDFSSSNLEQIITWYMQRDRRFGAINEIVPQIDQKHYD